MCRGSKSANNSFYEDDDDDEETADNRITDVGSLRRKEVKTNDLED